MTKKGVDLSVNVIIVAAIALAVLVVLFMIFTGRLAIFSKGVSEVASCAKSCENVGVKISVQINPTECNRVNGQYLPGTYNDVVSPNVCCCVPK